MPGASRSLPVLLALACLSCGECQPGHPTGDGVDAGRGVRHREPVPELAESEPNDEAQRASHFRFVPTAPGSPLFKPLLGEISSDKDRDWITVDGQPARPVRRLVITPVDDADVAILWPADERAVTDLAGAGEPEIVENLVGPSSVTFAVVKGRSASVGRYRISVARSDVDGLHLEAEAGDAAPRALDTPSQVQGLFNYWGDRDRWTVTSLEGPLRLEYVPAPGVVSRLTVARAGDVLERHVVPAAAGTPVWVRPNFAPGTYEVTVELMSDVPGVAAAYSLRALMHPEPPKNTLLEVEPNDVSNPFVLDAPGRVMGYLHDARDSDVFSWKVGDAQVEPKRPWIVRAGFGGRSTPARMAIRSGDRGIAQGARTICNQVVQPGPLEVAVGMGEKAEADFPLRYQLAVEVHQAGDEEIEPNQERLQGTALKIGAVHQGFVFPKGDVDYWVFDVARKPAPAVIPSADDPGALRPSGAQYGLRLTSPGVDAQLELLDEDGAPVARTNRRGVGGTERLNVELPAGKYFAVVQGATPDLSACTRPYTLEISSK